jgi:hypothetical protein
VALRADTEKARPRASTRSPGKSSARDWDFTIREFDRATQQILLPCAAERKSRAEAVKTSGNLPAVFFAAMNNLTQVFHHSHHAHFRPGHAGRMARIKSGPGSTE